MKFISVCLLLIISNFAIAQSVQTVRGRISDAASKSPIPGASVIIIGTTPPKGTASDANGYFKITDVPVGRVSLKISSVGYEEISLKDIVVNAGKEVVLDLTLTESFNNLNEVVVSYDRSKDGRVTNNDMATVSSRAFNPTETLKYAGSLGDPSRMAANFAGVSGANDSRNDIVVRGNSPASLLWRLDGVNIPNPNHFGSLGTSGGPVSMINANLLAKSDFMTGAFPAEYANALGSVFDLRLRNGNDEKHEFLGQVAFNGLEFGAEGPLSKKSKASYLINYRYSVFGIAKNLGFQIAGTPVYQDLTAKINLPIGTRGTLTAWTIGGDSKITFLGKDVSTDGDSYGDENQNSRPKFTTMMGAVAYEHRFTDKTYAKFTVSGTRSRQNFTSDTVVYKAGDSKEIILEAPLEQALFVNEKISLNTTLHHKFNSKHKISTGVIVDLNQFDLTNRKYATPYNPTEKVLRNIEGETMQLQAFAQWKYRISERLTLNSGITALHYELNNKSAIEPRAGISYILNSASVLNVAYGLHSNLQPILVYFTQQRNADGSYSLPNKDLGFTKSHHIVVGYERNLTENLRLKAETYYQSIFDAPVEQQSSYYSVLTEGASFAPIDQVNLVNKGTGTNYGIELTLEKLLSNNYFFLLTTSLFDSKYKGSDKVERNTPFNSKYVVNVLAGKDFKVGTKGNLFTVSWKVTTAGGKYVRPINFEASKQTGGTVYDDSRAYDEQVKAYFRTDLKFSYKINRNKLTHEIALDLQNLSGQKNIFEQGYNPRTQRIGTAYQQGFLPVPFYRLTF